MTKIKSESVKAWGLIPKQYNENREISAVQFNKPINPLTYKFNEVVRVEIKEIT
jgi:hypothetical protein